MKKRRFIKNAVILTLTAILLRSAGMILRIYLSNVVGAEGMGLYQLIFSVYMLAATFATTGLTTAVTRLVADESALGSAKSVGRVVRRAIQLTVIIGAVITVLIIVFAEPIARYWIKDMRSLDALRILSLSLIFMGISSCFKGYFMARRKAALPSSAQIFEQTVRIIAAILLISRHGGTVRGACFAILFADTIAETLSCLWLTACYFFDKRRLSLQIGKRKAASGHITSRIIKIAAPIVAGRYINSILRTVENLSVPDCLKMHSGSANKALAQYGELKGMALPIIFFPSSFLMSMSSLLLPEVSESKALGDMAAVRTQVSRAVAITLHSSILISALFAMLSNPIGVIVYKSESVGFLIKVLSPLIPAMYLESVCDGMLKGLNQQNHSLVYSVIDSLFRIACIFAAVPKFGMAGFLGMMVVSNLFTCTMNVSRLMRVSKTHFDVLNWLVKPLLFIGIAAAVTYSLMSVLDVSLIVRSLLCVMLISVIYAALMFTTKTSGEMEYFTRWLMKKERLTRKKHRKTAD